MGICASCLGERRKDVIDEDDETRLMFDDPNNMHYGSFDQQQTQVDDPLEVQREIEALQRVVARTSNNMVDIYEVGPPDPATRAVHPPYGVDDRMARYHNLISKLNLDNDPATGDNVDWSLQDDENIEMTGSGPAIKIETGGEPLVGNFTDAMRAAA